MNIQHDPGGILDRFVKNDHEDLDDKFHGGVIIVEENHFILPGSLYF
jgi:hypothetical protein